MTDTDASPGSNSAAYRADHLRAYVERIEKLTKEKAEISVDIREVFAEAKASGFDPKTMREMLRLRKMDADKRAEQEALRDTYGRALGVFG